jgi:hypothetical protein
VREERLRSGSVKPDDNPHRIIVEHLDVAALADDHRDAAAFLTVFADVAAHHPEF